MHDRDPGIDRPACFQELQLRRAVDREVVFRRRHRIEMAGLRRQVEEKILAVEQMRQGVAAANIGDVDSHPIADIGDIGEIAAIFGDHAVDEQNLGAERDEAPRNRRADEAQTAGDNRPGAGIGAEARGGAHVFLVITGKSEVSRHGARLPPDGLGDPILPAPSAKSS